MCDPFHVLNGEKFRIRGFSTFHVHFGSLMFLKVEIQVSLI